MQRLWPEVLRASSTSHACLAATSKRCQRALEAPHEQNGLGYKASQSRSTGLLAQSFREFQQWQYHILCFQGSSQAFSCSKIAYAASATLVMQQGASVSLVP